MKTAPRKVLLIVITASGAVLLLALAFTVGPFAPFIASALIDDLRTKNISRLFEEDRAINLNQSLSAEEVCVFPPEAPSVSIIRVTYSAYAGNRFWDKDDPDIWTIVAINHTTKRWKMYTVDLERVKLELAGPEAICSKELVTITQRSGGSWSARVDKSNPK